MAGAGAAASSLCTTPLEAGCRRPYEAPEPTVSAHELSDPVGIRFRTVSGHRVRAGVQQERTAQYGGRMFVFAATLGVHGDRACAMRTRLGENRNFMQAP